jgi:uncharacterized spore protein YtfJ
LKMKWIFKLTLLILAFLFLFGVSMAQEKPKAKAGVVNPVALLTKAMTDRLTNNLHVKNVVGDPIKVGNVTIVPIIMIDVGFGGGGGGPSVGTQMGGHGFYMSGEARPMGFVLISKAGTKFVPVGKIPRK